MKRRHLDALATLGISKTSYAHTPDDLDQLARWGIELSGPHGTLYIEHTPRAHGGDGLYHLRPFKLGGQEYGRGYRRQQDAVAAAIRRWYR